ncbi:BMC domain-containing protein [Bacillaceae bacterium Marseille-Q3522]|nr:BMC domain-containing protein [Bacillaceae bacterium Marseille-Q3522]
MNQAIGMIEIEGLASAITIADTMAKVANVKTIGMERARGFGWNTIKLEGDVAAVEAAIKAGEAAAKDLGKFISQKVIPRPSESVSSIFFAPKCTKAQEKQETGKETVQDELIHDQQERAELQHEPDAEISEQENPEKEQEEIEPTCNLCHDPECKRKKGDPRSDCIHFEELNKKNKDKK